ALAVPGVAVAAATGPEAAAVGSSGAVVVSWSCRPSSTAGDGPGSLPGPAGEVSQLAVHHAPATTASSRTAEVMIRVRHRGATGGGSSQSAVTGPASWLWRPMHPMVITPCHRPPWTLRRQWVERL